MSSFPARFAIGPVTLAPATVLAPMAGVTDTVFRRFIRNLGGCGLIMTEFTSSHGVRASIKSEWLPKGLEAARKARRGAPWCCNRIMSTVAPASLPVVVRAQGVTLAELYLQRLCERSFLSLWSSLSNRGKGGQED